MPLYEYQCDNCGSTVEVIQKVNDEPLRLCASCGGRLERLLSAPAIQFKGSGWYITDYARKGNGKPASGKAAADSPSGSSSKPGNSSSKDSSGAVGD